MVTFNVNSVSPRTVASIENILTFEGKPINLKNLYIVDIKNRIKHMNLSNRRDFLGVCLNKSISTPEIVTLAKRVFSETGSCERQHKIEKKILKHRIEEKDRQIAESRKRINVHMKDIYIKRCLSDRGMNEYFTLRKVELNSKWDVLIDRRKRKISNLVNGDSSRTKIPETVDGVVISDEILDRMFESDDDPKLAIYGGIIPTKEISDFMMIPVSFRTF